MRTSGEAAFTAVAKSRERWLLRVAYSLYGDWQLAEDLTQDTLIRLASAWPLRDPAALDAWLRQTMTRLFIDQTRRHRWRRETVTNYVPEHSPPPTTEPGDVVLEALLRLPPRQRACIVLRHLDGLSVEETARTLRCSTGTVRSQSSRGLAALRAQLHTSSALTAPRGPMSEPSTQALETRLAEVQVPHGVGVDWAHILQAGPAAAPATHRRQCSRRCCS